MVAGQGELRLPDGERHGLEPETGVSLAPGQEYELRNETSDPMRIVCVRIRGSAPSDVPSERAAEGAADAPSETAAEAPTDVPSEAPAGAPQDGPAEQLARTTVRRLADLEAQDATTDRMFRIMADPETGLRSATHFVGYVPTVRAPDHFHTYDEVIYILEGEGAFHSGGTSRPIGVGSCIELPARTVHCLENTGPDVMRLVAVFRPPGSPAAAYYPDGTPAYPGTPPHTI